MSIVYIGTSSFALDVLVKSGLGPALVVTRPPAPRGRGRALAASPLAEGARALGLTVAEPARLGDLAQEIAALAPEVLCLCAYGALVREPLLSDHEILNVHPSLLPRWRGAAPIERALMAGDTRTGVSIIRLVEALDAGPVCAVAEVAIEPGDDYASLSERLSDAAAEVLVAALAGPRVYAEQDPRGASYAEKISAKDRELDPALPAEVLERTVRALHPHIGARLAGGLGVLRARLAPECPTPAGELVVTDGRLCFGATPGTLELLSVKPPGGRAMDAAAYVRGHAR